METLIGPISLSEHYSEKYDKHIFIFGEKHDKETKCDEKKGINIVNFIEQTLQSNKDKIIDIFLEQSFIYDEKNERNSYLKDIILKYKDYVDRKKKNKNFRIHWTDVRSILVSEFNIYFIFDSEFFSYEGGIFKIEMVKHLANLLKFANFEKLFIATKIEKQFDNIKDKNLRYTLEKYFDLKKNFTTKEEINELIDILLNSKISLKYKEIIQVTIEAVNKLWSFKLKIREYFLNLMDAYLIGRVFRNFKNYYSKYIIIYTGDYHARKYRKILKILNFELINETRNENQCLDITKFKLPFFQENNFKNNDLEKNRCAAITKSGFQCSRKIIQGTNYCWQHQLI